MALYTIGDLHLSLSGDHAMDVFPGWERYVGRIEENWRAKICADDTVVLPGDTSWGMSLEGALADFKFLESLPGKKIMLKGNHDYWWNTAAKMNRFFAESGFSTLRILHNNCYEYGGYALCGTRGWFYEEAGDQKVFKRELIRLEASLKAAGERPKLCFLHYPPLYQGYRCPEIIALLEQYGVERCYYGHLHGGSHRLAVEGRQGGVAYYLVSADYVGFRPQKICE